MTPDALFQVANPLVLLGWAALLSSPLWPRAADRVATLLVPGLLAVAYVALAAAYWSRAEGGGFGSLDEVAAVFAQRHVLLAGWLHYLAFDLLVGAMIVRQGRALALPFWVVLPCLPLTFLFGPAGFLLFLGLRLALRPGRPAPDPAPTA